MVATMKSDYQNIPFAIYARKSSTDVGKQILSIDSQLREMRDLARRNGYKIIREFEDVGSAHTPYGRDGFAEMMKEVSDGKIKGILAWKADRLARNPIEGGSILYALQNNKIEVIQTPYSTFLPTDNTLPLTIELGMANQYSLDLSKNVKRGNKTKIENGGFCSVAPHGYLNDVINKTIVKDPDRFHLLRKVWDLMLEGVYTLEELKEYANKELHFLTYKRKATGGSPLAKSTVHNMLINPFYYGRVKKGSNENWGNHEPMITQAEFEKVQQILRRSGRKSVATLDFPFTGAISCGECGCAITAEEKVKYRCPACGKRNMSKHPDACSCSYELTQEDVGKGSWYVYYHCTKKKGPCSQPCIRSTDLEKQIVEKLWSIEIDPDFEVWCIKWLKALNREQFTFHEKEYTRFQRAYETSEARLSGLIDMRANKELTEEEFMSAKLQAQKERDLAKGKLDRADNLNDTWLTKAGEELSFAMGLTKRFKDGTLKEKRYIFSRLGSHLILKDQKLHLEAQKYFILFKELQAVADLRVEPPETACVSGLNGSFDDERPKWLPRLDSNQ
jgi:DNA invertase Pin-like site-specific DNA recombinase/predicted RNA-binding Zn-ribbon protein involved in translation (DUF1610 family)